MLPRAPGLAALVGPSTTTTASAGVGLRLLGLHYRGALFDVSFDSRSTNVTLASNAPGNGSEGGLPVVGSVSFCLKVTKQRHVQRFALGVPIVIHGGSKLAVFVC